jgi:hypothetical protein
MDIEKIDKDISMERIRKKFKKTIKQCGNDVIRNRRYHLIKNFRQISKTFVERNVLFPKDGKKYVMNDAIHIEKFLYENVGIMNKVYIKKKKRFAYLTSVKLREEAN